MDNITAKKPRKNRTIDSEALSVVILAGQIFSETDPANDGEELAIQIFANFLVFPAPLGEFLENLSREPDDTAPEEHGMTQVNYEIHKIAEVAIAYAADARKAHKGYGELKGEEECALSYICDAVQQISLARLALTLVQNGVVGASVLSGVAKKAAKARHAENHAMKDEAIAYYEKNKDRFKSQDAAAEAIAGKVVPVTFRTVRGWIAEHRKMQSARKL